MSQFVDPNDPEVLRVLAEAQDGIRAAELKTIPNEGRPRAVGISELKSELHEIWKHGMGRGDATGWPCLDAHYSVARGQLTTITGYPNSGKSQFLDALALNLARQGWRFCFCSLENIPVSLHAEKLLKQYANKPVRPGLTEPITEDEISEALDEMRLWFSFLVPTEQKPNPSLLDVLDAIEYNFRERGIWGDKEAKLAAVIDPWNELEHFRPSGMSLTEHVGESLSMLRQWARQKMLHLFIVAHPSKQYRNRETTKLPVATPDMISDSAHFWNKSDNCITVALQDEHNSPQVDIHVQKIRFSHIGKRGMATLKYDVVTGRYSDEQTGVWPSRMREKMK